MSGGGPRREAVTRTSASAARTTGCARQEHQPRAASVSQVQIMSAPRARGGRQLGDRLAVPDDVGRPPCAVGQGDLVVVDAEVVVDRGEEVVGADATVQHVLAAAVGGADDPAGGDAATGPE